ncbi:hypothetical protein GCM10022223_18930 [Kineosporia mesophila]|uniref:Uncharacterized protein n=1 Tax=Kineosporia mesophila TaxID=566012 RepID=A0ABP6ZE12_9ACTN|nr:hypothetical protein [Kineosporia mesophila]MCD5353418.1 hypothetical protein [Kineosporia mesophila]
MASAVVGLIGAVIGGLLVTLGDLMARRIERRADRREQLRLAAAGVIASYLHARSHLIVVHRQGQTLNHKDIWPDDRYIATAQLFTLPGAEHLHELMGALRNATLAMYEETDLALFALCCDEQMAAIQNFETRIRELSS